MFEDVTEIYAKYTILHSSLILFGIILNHQMVSFNILIYISCNFIKLYSNCIAFNTLGTKKKIFKKIIMNRNIMFYNKM